MLSKSKRAIQFILLIRALIKRERITIVIMIGYGNLKRTFDKVINLFNDTFPNQRHYQNQQIKSLDKLSL